MKPRKRPGYEWAEDVTRLCERVASGAKCIGDRKHPRPCDVRRLLCWLIYHANAINAEMEQEKRRAMGDTFFAKNGEECCAYCNRYLAVGHGLLCPKYVDPHTETDVKLPKKLGQVKA
jgi:hypothetical protein